MLKNVLRVSTCIALAATTAACATVTRGVKEGWTVTSQPAYAQVTTSNGFSCEATPCTFKMNHRSTFDVTISKVGYRTFHGHVINQVSSGGGLGMAGNVILGGAVGVVVDVASGAMMELKPNPMNITLERDTAVALPPGQAEMPLADVGRF